MISAEKFSHVNIFIRKSSSLIENWVWKLSAMRNEKMFCFLHLWIIIFHEQASLLKMNICRNTKTFLYFFIFQSLIKLSTQLLEQTLLLCLIINSYFTIEPLKNSKKYNNKKIPFVVLFTLPPSMFFFFFGSFFYFVKFSVFDKKIAFISFFFLILFCLCQELSWMP
jgi:hypothetical protein